MKGKLDSSNLGFVDFLNVVNRSFCVGKIKVYFNHAFVGNNSNTAESVETTVCVLEFPGKKFFSGVAVVAPGTHRYDLRLGWRKSLERAFAAVPWSLYRPLIKNDIELWHEIRLQLRNEEENQQSGH